MTDRFDDYWKDFFIKDFLHWQDVYSRTRNPEAEKRMNETRDVLYRRWLIVFDDGPKKLANGQGLLF